MFVHRFFLHFTSHVIYETGAGIAGVLMDSTHAYRSILKLGFAMCVLSFLFLTCMLYPGNFGLLLFAFGICGELLRVILCVGRARLFYVVIIVTTNACDT
jgi:hypothetical protein